MPLFIFFYQYDLQVLFLYTMKIDKYDRQIRLWGAQGQYKLRHAKVALLGCSGSGIETLKNLVLPGISSIEIWDNTIIQVTDLCESFFYTEESVGKEKGQQALKNILEMNPQVVGKWHNESFIKLLDFPERLKGYDLVISCDNGDDLNRKISEVCWKNEVAVLFSINLGFMFYIRLQKQHHYVENQSSDESKYYLRLSDPFQGLLQYSSQWDIPSLMAKVSNCSENQKKQVQDKISIIPFPIILLQAYKNLAQNNRKMGGVRDLLNLWTNQLDSEKRRNFREAQSKIFDLFRTPDNFLLDIEIFNNPKIQNATEKSHIFCVFLKAVSILYSQTGRIPQPTKLPDIDTTTVLYLSLKNVYKQEHLKSVKEIIKIIHNLFPQYIVDENIISSYIDNINGLEMVETNSYIQELDHPNFNNLNQNSERNIYIALRVYQIFRTRNKKCPKLEDIQQLTNIANEYTAKNNLTKIDDKFVHEVGRSSGKQFISLISMVGAIGAQQVIKIITNCFCPMKNGYLFNGITSSGSQCTI